MKIKKSVIEVVILLALALALVSASFSYNSNSVKTDYTGGDKISGRVNLNISDEPIDSEFTSSFPGSITLIDMLKANGLNETKDYNCSVSGCQDVLRIKGNALASYNLAGGEKIFGMKITESGVSGIDTFTLNISGNAASSCSQPLNVEVADSGLFFQGSGYGLPCGIRNYGCFNSSATTTNVLIGDTSFYCEEVSLPDAPAYEIGAKLIKETAGAVITASLWSGNGDEEYGECNLQTPVTGYEEVACTVNYSSSNGQTFQVCISADAEGYKLKSETAGEKCGSENRDYEIFGRAMSFAANPEIRINSESDEVIDSVLDYIDDNYNGNCPEEGCVIPLKILGQPQTLNFNGARITYEVGSTLFESEGIFEIEEAKPTVTGKNIGIELRHANFTIPLASTAKTFTLRLGGSDVLSAPVEIVKGFDFDINPKFVPVEISTLFSISTTQNVTSAVWNFGDGTIPSTSYGRNISHRYSNEGTFIVSVAVTNSQGFQTTREFAVSSGNARQSAEILISQYEVRISNITKQINAFPAWINTEIKKQVDVVSLNASVTKAKSDLNLSSENASNILSSLSSLGVPYAVAISRSSNYPLAIGYANIDTSLVGEYSNEAVANSDDTINSIINWANSNYDASVRAEKISSYGDDGSEVVISHFYINLAPKISGAEGANLFINYPLSAIVFEENYGQMTVGSGVYIPLTGESQTIELLVPQDIEFENLGVYISPSLSSLPHGFLGAIQKALGPHFEFSWAKFIVLLLILTILFLTVYIILQEWFKKNYERGMFPNPDDLYNLMTFIRNSRNKGLSDEEVKRKLKLAGWRKEQIEYGFKKINGEKLLKFEIPLFRSREKKQVEKEIAKRGGGPERFIKR